MATNVNDRSPAASEMGCEWPMIDALLGGTRTMRAAAKTYLPKWPMEEEEAYRVRLETATLYPAFERTVDVMSGKPFSKALTMGDDVPERIKELCDDCDLEGRNLHTFAADVCRNAIGKGIAGVLVDFPKVGSDVKTQADEAAVGARPYFVWIRPEQILGWKVVRMAGVTRLTQLRLAETAEVDDGEYGSVTKQRVRVLKPGSWEVFERNADGVYTLLDQGTTTLDAVPFVPFYGKRVAFMVGKAPLLNLAYLNVKHWQSQSDQDTITHVARVPILFGKGFEDTEAITIGAKHAVASSNSNADLKYVEHTGKAIEAGQKSLEDLEQQMVQTGAELLVQKGVVKSATEDNNDAEAAKSDLQRIVEGFEDSLDQCLQFMADWLKQPEGGHVQLFKDFGAATLSDASAQLISTLQQAGLISKETAIRELQRRGTLAPDIDPTEEAQRVQEDGPALGSLSDPNPNDPAAAGG